MSMPDEKAVSIRIRGYVQGVGYRAFVLKNSHDFKVNGFVRNEPDGSIYIEAQGDPKELRRFVGSCKYGPELARVDHFTVEDMKPKRVFGFTLEK